MSDPAVPTSWRQRTTSLLIPYRFLDIDGEFSFEPSENPDAQLRWRALIAASTLEAFVSEMLPTTTTVGSIEVPIYKPYPGLPYLVAKRVHFKTQAGIDQPSDPFLVDPFADAGTYHELLEVEVEFGTTVHNLTDGTPDANNPITFLEISANATGEFLHSPAPNAKWDPGGGAALEAVKEQLTPLTVKVTSEEWTARWPKVTVSFFENTLLPRMRTAAGKVNSSPFSLLFGAEAETVLFDGWGMDMRASFTETYLSVDMKFIEKRIELANGQIAGHNHFWRPGKGWQKLLIDGIAQTAHETTDLNLLVQI